MFSSIILTTYNRPDALAATLAGLAAQSDRDFEVLVADDGSRSETATLVKRLANDYSLNLIHIWQADRGFRAGAARNKAALAASGEYLIFLDGDCVPRPDFVAQHRNLAEQGWMVAGNRILLSEALTRDVLTTGSPIHHWTIDQWKRVLAKGGINRSAPLRRLALGPLRKLQAHRWQRVRTCNLGVWATDFQRINGFDESFEGWGFEDSDLAVRLLNAGVRRKEGAYATGVLHLWHRENDRARKGVNWERLMRRIAAGETLPEIGLDRPDRD